MENIVKIICICYNISNATHEVANYIRRVVFLLEVRCQEKGCNGFIADGELLRRKKGMSEFCCPICERKGEISGYPGGCLIIKYQRNNKAGVKTIESIK